jgi:hypothetical protein
VKTRVLIFLFFHFSVILILAIDSTKNAYYEFHSGKSKTNSPDIPIVSYLAKSFYNVNLTRYYLIFSGTNTGYGFYGMSPACEKYLAIELYDETGQLLKQDEFLNFRSTSGYSRLQGFASKLANYLAETDQLIAIDSTSVGAKKLEAFRKLYIEKVFKWLGRGMALNTPNCKSYKVKLLTILPINIWNTSQRKPTAAYVYKEHSFILE